MAADAPSRIEIESMVGRQDREPYVLLAWGDEKGRLTPTEARHHARRILEAAEAADQDAFMVSFLVDQVHLDMGQALRTLYEFREWRSKRDAEIEGGSNGR